MLEKVGELIASYCMWVLTMIADWIGKTHGVVGVGLPILAMVAAHKFLPSWVGLSLVLTIVAPAMAGLVYVLVVGLSLRK